MIKTILRDILKSTEIFIIIEKLQIKIYKI